MQVEGNIKVIGQVQSFGTGDFTKRELVVTTSEQYPQVISIDFLKDKCDLLNSYNLNDNVTVSINLGGREWINKEGVAKYFNSVTGWKIEKAAGATKVASPPTVLEQEDDLPF